jgi:hypothetical protein
MEKSKDATVIDLWYTAWAFLALDFGDTMQSFKESHFQITTFQ